MGYGIQIACEYLTARTPQNSTHLLKHPSPLRAGRMRSPYALEINGQVSPQAEKEKNSESPFSARSTALDGWRLTVEEGLGRLKWKYLATDAERSAQPQDRTSRFFLDLPIVRPQFSLFLLRSIADQRRTRHLRANQPKRPQRPRLMAPSSTVNCRSKT